MSAEFGCKVHHGYIEPILRTGRAPSGPEVAGSLGLPLNTVHETLRSLSQTHGVVLHPHICEPWVIHPFSASPSATWVEGADRGWWAPCIWCAFGIAALAGEAVVVHTRIGGESEDIDIHVSNGKVEESGLFVHFAVPPRAAWDNVHHFCATVLAFRGAEQVDDWSERHGIPVGSVIPVQQCADLGRAWYSKHADANWRKWSVQQAAEIFGSVGLTGDFWALPRTEDSF